MLKELLLQIKEQSLQGYVMDVDGNDFEIHSTTKDGKLSGSWNGDNEIVVIDLESIPESQKKLLEKYINFNIIKHEII